MKLVRPSFEIWEQEPGLEGVYKQIEKAAKVCYKSEGNITENSAKPFIDNVLLKRQHYSPLEHGTVYLYNPGDKQMPDMINRYSGNPYSRLHVVKADLTGAIIGPVWITTNYRVIVENNWVEDLLYRVNPAPLHPRRITVHFVCDRGVSHEFVRHRVMSFAQESTRYCNYSKDKFGNELTFIQPCWLNEERLKLYGPYHTVIRDKSPESIFIASLNCAERDYLDLLEAGWKPQQAREVLPNACKTELVMTGFVDDWKHFFFLRCPVNAHPQVRELAIPLSDEFVKRGYIKQ